MNRFTKIIFDWFKSNYIILVVSVIIGAGISGYVVNKIGEQKLSEAQAKYDREYQRLILDQNKVIDDINKISAEAAEKERIAMQDYQQKLETLDKKYQDKLAEIELLRKVKAQELAKIIKKDPEAAMNEIAKKFGFDIIVAPKD